MSTLPDYEAVDLGLTNFVTYNFFNVKNKKVLDERLQFTYMEKYVF